MEIITLTPAQAAQLEPLTRRAYATGGTIFCQIQRAAFPNNGAFVLKAHLVPAESSRRLRTFLTKEAQRISTQHKTNKTP